MYGYWRPELLVLNNSMNLIIFERQSVQVFPGTICHGKYVW